MSERTALLVGNGGREHAIAEQIAPVVDTLWFSGDNAGLEVLPSARRIPVGADLGEFAVEKQIDLTIIGPEKPLVEGMSDKIRQSGLHVFGPSKEASFLESSKYAARIFMSMHTIASPEVLHFFEDANSFEPNLLPDDVSSIVIKANGLAGGKGVVLPDDRGVAIQTIQEMLLGQSFDGAGRDGVLIEQRCHGPEVSMFVLSDGYNHSVLPFTQDHKRLGNGDTGPNTGGMGAYLIPNESFLTDRQQIKLHEIAQQSIDGMAEDGMPFKGVLYVGAMLAEEYDGDPVVIEYNVRFGDPEAQVLMHRLGENTFDILLSTDMNLRQDLLTPAQLSGKAALTHCLAADGYPDQPRKGDDIYGLDNVYNGVTLHHGGTKFLSNGQTVTNGGRVLYVTGYGESIDEAAAHAADAIDVGGIGDGVHFLGMQHREDIGWQVRS